MASQMPDVVKRAFQKDKFTVNKVEELEKCMDDPIYFAKKYVKIQHSTKGMIDFTMFDYQEEMINIFHKHTRSIILAGRQLGKCLCYSTILTHNKSKVKFSNIIKLNIKQRLVAYLEELLLKLAK